MTVILEGAITDGLTSMHNRFYTLLLLGLSVSFSPALGAAPASTTQDLDALRQDLDALKQGQEAIARDVAAIKELLESLRPPPPVRPIDALVAVGSAPTRGSADARLALIEFSDYQCPFCKRQFEMTLPQIEKDYVATGKVRYVVRDFPLESIHALAFQAAEAAHCAGAQGKFWEMRDALFANQEALASEDLLKYARDLSLDMNSFKQCLESRKYAEQIRISIADGKRLGIAATPAVLLGVIEDNQVKVVRLMEGALPLPVFKEEIEKLLADAPGPDHD